MVHVLADLAIYEEMSQDPEANILAPFTTVDAEVETLRVCKMIYLPTPLIRLFLDPYITPAGAWKRLCSAIVDIGQEVDFQPIINLLCIALTKKVGDDKFPLTLTLPTAPLANGKLLHHRHHMLNRNLPGMDPALHRIQGSLIATNIGEFVVELNQDREAKA